MALHLESCVGEVRGDQTVCDCWDGSWYVCDSGLGYGHTGEQVGRHPNQEIWPLPTPSYDLGHLASVPTLKNGANNNNLVELLWAFV